MEGTEGIKILTQGTSQTITNTGMLIALIGAITMIVLVMLIAYAFFNKPRNKALSIGTRFYISALFSLMVFLALYSNYYDIKTTYKVTPIEDKYYIDLNKYKIIKTEGEIIHLLEK